MTRISATEVPALTPLGDKICKYIAHHQFGMVGSQQRQVSFEEAMTDLEISYGASFRLTYMVPKAILFAIIMDFEQ